MASTSYYHFDVVPQAATGLAEGKDVLVKWRRTLAKGGTLPAAGANREGVASFGGQAISFDTSIRHKASASGGSGGLGGVGSGKTLTLWLKERPTERPGLVATVVHGGSKNPTIAKGSLALADHLGVVDKPVQVALRPKAHSDAFRVGEKPMLNLLVSSRLNERSKHEE
eukprot:m51a1_g8573 hypothetical protein (169) ;mRNA; f:202468-203249